MLPSAAGLIALLPLAFGWEAPPACPQADAVVAGVKRWLEREPIAELDALQVHAVVTEEAGLFSLVLDTRLGRRQLSAASCAELTQAAAVVLALLLEPTLFGAPAPPKPPPAPPAPPPPPPPPPAPLQAYVRAGAVADVGTMPSPSPGWSVAAGVDKGALRVELFGGGFAPQRASAPGGRAATLSLDFEAGARGCFAFRGSRVQPLGCAAFALGRLTGNGEGIALPNGGRSLWASVMLGLGVRVELVWRLAAVVQLELAVPLVRTRWAFDDLVNPLYQTPALVGRGTAGLEVRWW